MMTIAELSERFRIPRELLEALRVCHCTDLEVRELLGVHGRDGQDLSGIAFPYRDPRDACIVGYRVRRDDPEIGGDGKPIDKYISDQGNRHFFFCPIPAEWLADVSIPVILVEAEKSALAIHALMVRNGNKAVAIAIGGCWGWKRTNGKEELPDGGTKPTTGPSPDFNLMTWTGRQAIVLFDSNVATKFEVQWARADLSKHLILLGAKVFHAAVPIIPGVNGPDDFIAMATDDEAVERMLNRTELFDAAPKENKGKISESTEIVNAALSAGLDLFHDSDGSSFVSIEINGHRETWSLRSRQLKNYLSYLIYQKRQRVANTNSVSAALGVLEAMALFYGSELKVHVRVAESEGVLWLDLGNRNWEVIRIGKDGWRVVSNPTVRFRHSRGMQALPYPVRGGSISELWDFLNLRNDSDRVLVVAWLIAALRPHGPYPILAFHGEHGTAKSTATRVQRSLVDPYAAPIRTLPTDERDLQISARASHVLAFDNVSKLTQEQSDWLCRLATGGGLGTRELYTDEDEVIFDAQRPIVLNGIEDVATRGDFADRCVVVYLEEIKKVQAEQEFWAAFTAARPRILGALLDAMVVAVNRSETVVLERPPRMADFARWAVAAETSLGFKEGSFLSAYNQNRAAANDLALDSSLITEPIKAFMEDRDYWEGINADLLVELRRRVSDEVARSSGFPKTARKLSGDLRRLAPNLRRIGIDVRFLKPSGHEKRRLLEITKIGEKPSATSAPCPGTDSAGPNGMDAPLSQSSATAHNGTEPSTVSDSKHGFGGGADVADGLFPAPSLGDDGEVRI